ncbi:MAG: hypothetical protein ABID45_03650, partial [Patescibacteria group bacterium]
EKPYYVHYYRNFDNQIRSFKIINPITTKLENFKKYKRLWETGFYDQYLKNDKILIEKIKYTYFNNKKHKIKNEYNDLFKKYRYISPKYQNLL